MTNHPNRSRKTGWALYREVPNGEPVRVSDAVHRTYESAIWARQTLRSMNGRTRTYKLIRVPLPEAR